MSDTALRGSGGHGPKFQQPHPTKSCTVRRKKDLLLKPFSTLTVVKIIESGLDWSLNPATQIWSDSDMPPPSLGSLAFPAPRAGQILQSITVAPNFSPSVSLPIRTVICPDEIAASVLRKSNSVLGF